MVNFHDLFMLIGVTGLLLVSLSLTLLVLLIYGKVEEHNGQNH